MGARLSAWALEGIPEVREGDDLAALVIEALDEPLLNGDIVVVTSKIVSKAEGRVAAASGREDAITAETVRVVASRTHPSGTTTRIVENRLGIVAAAAGVDASNTAAGTILLLPVDPDASAHALCLALRERTGARVGVVVSDTLGRPWRIGQTDVAIGAAGVRVVDDLRGTRDASGRALDVTLVAVADELAALTDLVKGKAGATPVAVVRGLGRLVTEPGAPGARSLVRPSDADMFRLGTEEAIAEGYRLARAEASSDAGPAVQPGRIPR